MQVLAAVLCTGRATVPVEDSVVGDLHLVVQVDELLHVLILVFHVVSLADVTYDSGVEALHHKFKGADSKRISWLQIVVLLRLKHLIETARLIGVHIEVAH